tara:strand:+ start:620 stop:952 length:333 start_codon:yes stop_codon:yes gene_type:complete
MKKNVKYVKDVLNKIKNEARKIRERLFYSVGIISVLFLLIAWIFDNNSPKIEEPKILEIKVEKVSTNEVETIRNMTFSQKFKVSREYYGKNGRFIWKGNPYHCKYKEEME